MKLRVTIKRRFYFSAIALFCIVLSCTQDSYEKGEGRYSQMRGDFAEMHINSDKKANAITTDDGDQLPLKDLFSSQWIATADTTYRCILYYNKVKGGDGKMLAEIISAGQVPCVQVKPLKKFEGKVCTDPVKFESIWMSKTGKYLNLSLQLMIGQTDDTTAIHQLGLLSDTLIVNPNGKRTLHVFLNHDQGKVPEYYSTQVYMSVPASTLDADSVSFKINTYSGIVEKTLSITPYL